MYRTNPKGSHYRINVNTGPGNDTYLYYGIKGDGINDDTKGLRDYAYDLKEKGGGVLKLPSFGKLLIKGTISIPSNVLVEGNMSEFMLANDYDLDSRVQRGVSNLHPYITTELNSKNITFRDFTVTGNTNDTRKEKHVGLGILDAEDVVVENVNSFYINYDRPLADDYGNNVMAYNLFVLGSKNVRVLGGSFDYGGYECVGTESSEDVVFDGIYSGQGWRTSFQTHRGSEKIKLVNSTINQVTETNDSGTITTHGVEGESIKDLIIANNIITGQMSETPDWNYNAVIQLMDGGKSKSIKILNNTIRGNYNGLYGTPADDFMLIGNDIEVENGRAVRIPPEVSGIIDQNIINSVNGDNFVNQSTNLKLGLNIGVE